MGLAQCGCQVGHGGSGAAGQHRHRLQDIALVLSSVCSPLQSLPTAATLSTAAAAASAGNSATVGKTFHTPD